MMVYPDDQWPCSTTAPMLQLYDDVGYRGQFNEYFLKILVYNPFTHPTSLTFSPGIKQKIN